MLKQIALSGACLAGIAIMPGDDIELARDTLPIPVTVYRHPDLDPTTTTTVVPEPVRSVEITAEVIWADDRRQPTPPAPDIPPMMDRCPQWQTIALEQGWPPDEQLLNTLDRVIYRESRCDPTQHNPEDPMGGSHGLTQLNGFWCRPTEYWPDGWLQAQEAVVECDDLYDPATNLRAALLIWHNSGWAPWGI